MAHKLISEDMQFPTAGQIEAAIFREKYSRQYKKVLMSTLSSLIVVAAIAVLVATLVLPVLQIKGSSMEPTLFDEEIVVLVKSSSLQRGQLCCFSYQNKLLIKRIIGLPGDTITIDENGDVYVNGAMLEEPYVLEKAFGECDITFPVTVSENHYFILGDHRSTSIDSRSSVVGQVHKDQVVGKIFFRVWPFENFGLVDH